MEITNRASCALALLAGMLLTACSASEPRSELLARDSGMAVRLPADAPPLANSPIVNFISVVTPYYESTGTFSYYTGGASGGRTAIDAPDLLVAQVQADNVSVEIKTDGENQYAYTEDEALRIARHVSASTREFWPQSALPVAVELHLVRKDAAYDFSRLIRWNEGMPYHLTLFVLADDKERHAHTAVHELYHVLALRWQLGRHGPLGDERPWLGHALEETTAELLAHCAELVAERSLAYSSATSMVLTPDGNGGTRKFSDLLSAADLQYLLEPPDERKPSGSAWTFLLAKTALKAVFGADQTVALGTPAGDTLLTLCKEAARDPLSLSPWFKRLATDAEASTSAAL